MNPIELIKEVEKLGGTVSVENGQIVIDSPRSLPTDLIEQITQEKPSLMVALGAPIEPTIATILEDIRPHLPVAIRSLPANKLLIMVNWSIMAAWGKAVQKIPVRENASGSNKR